MATKPSPFKPSQGLSVFERYLTVWVLLCIAAGIGLGSVAPGIATFLDGLSLYVGDAPVVSIPIAICLFFMMYPIMVKIDFAEVIRAGKASVRLDLPCLSIGPSNPSPCMRLPCCFSGPSFSI